MNLQFLPDRGGRRSGGDRRSVVVTFFEPERRSGADRRYGEDRRSSQRCFRLGAMNEEWISAFNPGEVLHPSKGHEPE